MNVLLITIAFTFMTGMLFYQEQTDRSFNVRAIPTGWLAAGLLLRITLFIVIFVLLCLNVA